jgi:thymidylate synthase (FAD)
MKIIKPSFEILDTINAPLIIATIEKIARVCYKSEDRITANSGIKFVQNLISKGHEAMLEHVSISVKFICDRGVSHEIVRHRIGSYAMQSSRYCNYSKDKFGKEITVIEPFFFRDDDVLYNAWKSLCEDAEKTYMFMLSNGATPEQARSVLPHSVKTEIVCTYNLREWRHFLKLRTARNAHPQMRELITPLLDEFKQLIPVIFDDIIVENTEF